MNFFIDSFGNYSSKRLSGFMLILTACYGTLLSFSQQTSEFISLILGIATIGAGLLGSTMAERKLKE